METAGIGIYISTTLHIVAQVLMIPVMILLVLLILFALYCVAAVITEIFTERRHFKVNLPQVINTIHDASYQDVDGVIASAALLRPQKEALLTVVRNMGLTADDLFALAKTQIGKVNDRYKRTTLITDQVTKIAPMLGLMCTLIPLGPGIVAMGEGNVTQLSTSLLIAFDGTVAGLIGGVVAMLVSAIRKRWYAQYITALEALMTTVLDKAAVARNEGKKLPHNYWPNVDKLQAQPTASSPTALAEV